MKKIMRGFSLLELAIIILLLGMVTVLVWRFISVRVQQKATVVERSLLEQADWALTGFAMRNSRLPCPDSDADGFENCSAAASNQVNSLPYRTLGMADIRAGRITYGVLRRTTEVNDPEADAENDPSPLMPRDAELTVAKDRFYPLLGTIAGTTPPNIIEFDTALTQGVVATNIRFEVINGLDFCQALRVAEDPEPDNVGGNVHVIAGDGAGIIRQQVAYALALPGTKDADGQDGLNDAVNGLAFLSPQAGKTYLNDDRVRAVSLGVLWSRLGCGEAIASIGHSQPNAATAAVMLYRGFFDYWQVLEQAVNLADAQILIATAGLLNAIGNIIDAAAAVSHAVGDVALEGNVASAVAAAAMVVAAATTLEPAILSLNMAVETKGMAEMRRDFMALLISDAEILAKKLLVNVQDADSRGLHQGR